MNTLSREFLEEIEAEVVEEVSDLIDDLFDDLVEDGSTYGDMELDSDEDFVMFYMDILNHQIDPAMPPVNLEPYLQVVNPRLAEQWRQRFNRASGRMMGVR